MLHRWIAAAFAVSLGLTVAGAARADNGQPVDGQIEQFLLSIPTSQGALDDSAWINREAHYPGSSGDHKLAIWMGDQLASYGFKTEIEPVYAQVPILKKAVLQLLVKPSVDFDLKEVPIPQDPDASRSDSGVPFNAWSGSGDVTAPLVYANHGLDEDYQSLDRAHVDVTGKIVLVRYGTQFRGELARRAMDHGAAGVLLYTEPADRDGSDRGVPYPDGPYRPMGSVQRGSLGGPVLKIPVLPVSALTARRLLQDIAGQAPPASWIGGMDAQYALGTTRDLVHLRVDESYNWIWIWNTIAVLPGQDGAHTVILGGHRDAWVYGVTDNGSGISTLLEAARALGYIYQAGWRPKYSIEIAGWDGEEIGEAGSQSYVRTHFWSLSRGCIAYVNADETATGDFFYTTATAALAPLAPPIARLVPDPHEPTQTVWDKWRKQNGGVQTFPPGGRSDHDAFLYLLGIPTIEMAFGGPFGAYHSAFDDLTYASTQADPHFANHQALSQMLALTAFRLTSDSRPYRLDAYVPAMRQAIGQLSGNNGTGVSLEPVARAIDRFAAAGLESASTANAIAAVHRIDLLFYGYEGYTAVAFPKLTEAMNGGDRAAVQAAVDNTANELDAIAHTLE
ncbi:MAG: M28 family peptidase [Candidatus Eremiobacteraeota bacterium]|nr:M28 family peptidase [Candidatus Eremiobacteraeota bacterium]MBV8432959.1 M28 family peptidase [Candidatus Eremiobacteraeota bacterium]